MFDDSAKWVPPCLIVLVASLLASVPVQAEGDAKRLILNHSADSLFECVPFDEPLSPSVSKAAVIDGYHKLIDRYVGSNITHILFNVNFQRLAYDSEVCETYWDCPNPTRDTSGWPLKSWYVHRTGVDPFDVCIKRSRVRGFSPWVSVRMNDTHYNDVQHKMFSLWWDHPEYRRGVGGFHNGFDFSHEPVRELYMSLIREVLERYDADGLELDWMRFPYHFKPGQEQAGLKILTDFTREVRQLTKAWTERRGHAVELAARVPSTPDMAAALGMDAVRWVQEGLVDVLIPTSTWMPTDTDMPMEVWRERIGENAPAFTLAAGADLYVQGVPGGSLMKDTLESQRGFTAAMLHRGADCIYLFNHFNHKDFVREFTQPDGGKVVKDEYADILAQAGDLDKAAHGPRRHVQTFRDTNAPGVSNPRALPYHVDGEKAATFRINIGPKPKSGSVTLRLGLDQKDGLWEAVLSAQANGTECEAAADLNKPGDFKPHKDGGYRYKDSVALVAPRVAQFNVPLSAIQAGFNTFNVGLREGAPQTIVWLEVYVAP